MHVSAVIRANGGQPQGCTGGTDFEHAIDNRAACETHSGQLFAEKLGQSVAGKTVGLGVKQPGGRLVGERDRPVV